MKCLCTPHNFIPLQVQKVVAFLATVGFSQWRYRCSPRGLCRQSGTDGGFTSISVSSVDIIKPMRFTHISFVYHRRSTILANDSVAV
jgi:hypothetical protein